MVARRTPERLNASCRQRRVGRSVQRCFEHGTAVVYDAGLTQSRVLRAAHKKRRDEGVDVIEINDPNRRDEISERVTGDECVNERIDVIEVDDAERWNLICWTARN